MRKIVGAMREREIECKMREAAMYKMRCVVDRELMVDKKDIDGQLALLLLMLLFDGVIELTDVL